MGFLFELIRAERAAFCTCKRSFSPVANLLTHVVSFAVDKAAEEAVGESVPTQQERRWNFLMVCLSTSGLDDVDSKLFKQNTRKQGKENLTKECMYSTIGTQV